LANIIKKQLKVHSLARQQSYEQSYYQQLMTSANTAFSYCPIQQQSYEEPSYIYIYTHTVPRLAYDDCLMPSFLHQYNSSMETPQTVPVLSTSLPLAQGHFFSAIGYTPQPLAQEDLFIALGHTPVITTQIQESTCVQGAAQGLQFIPHSSQQISPCAQFSWPGRLQSVQPSVRIQQTEGYQLPVSIVQPMAY
jgi:hypothetical protein